MYKHTQRDRCRDPLARRVRDAPRRPAVPPLLSGGATRLTLTDYAII